MFILFLIIYQNITHEGPVGSVVMSLAAYRIVNKVVNGALFLSHPNPFLSIKLIQHVKFINLFCHIADQKMNVILCDVQTAMTEKLGERYNIAAIQDPLLCEGVSIPMNPRRFNTAFFIIFIKHMIASAFDELLAEDVTEEKIVILRVLSIFQVLRQDIDHRLIQRHDQRLSVFRDVDIHDVIIKVNVFDLNVHQTSLSNSRTEQEVCHHPALILGKIALLKIRLFE